MNRRRFFQAVMGLPLLRWLKPKPPVDETGISIRFIRGLDVERYDRTPSRYDALAFPVMDGTEPIEQPFLSRKPQKFQ